MKAFVELCFKLDQTNKSNAKIAHLKDYYSLTPATDAAWAVFFLYGKKLKKTIPAKLLRDWAMMLSNIPEWMFTECRLAIGESAETISLLLPDNQEGLPNYSLKEIVEEILIPLLKGDKEILEFRIKELWLLMSTKERFIFNKLISGHFRLGVSKQTIMRALAKVAEVEVDIIALRLMGEWQPSDIFFNSLINPNFQKEEKPIARPYPFHLAYPLTTELENLGDISEWQAEWKWDGIRCQLVKREGVVFMWSRGEELITEQFPEIAEAAISLPDYTVLDGEILVWKNSKVQPFSSLQKRIGKKVVSKKIKEDLPVVLLCYDIIENEGKDLRPIPLGERRRILEGILKTGSSQIRITDVLSFNSWQDLVLLKDSSKKNSVEGLMIKSLNSPYISGRKKGYWWKWKIKPYTIDAVLIYAQKGTGKRAGLFTDYTFGVWKDQELVPFAKAYSGLNDEEILQVDAFVKRNTKDKFGPVRSVTPKMVFEIAFEGIQFSSRHKSGIAVRFPRILRIRNDKMISDADNIESLKALIKSDTNA